MPSGMPKMTRCAPGTKSHGPDEVLDVAYLQGLLGDVRTGIQNGKGRKRELSDQNAKLQKYVKNLRREEEELLAKIDYIKNELCKEKSRAAWLKQHSKRSSESRSMGQNSNGFQHFLPDNHWIHHSSYPKNRVFSPAPYSQVSPSFMSHGGFVSAYPPQHPRPHGNTYHFQHPPVPPHPPPSNYVPNPHYPQSGNPLYTGFPGSQYYPERMRVLQYVYRSKWCRKFRLFVSEVSLWLEQLRFLNTTQDLIHDQDDWNLYWAYMMLESQTVHGMVRYPCRLLSTDPDPKLM